MGRTVVVFKGFVFAVVVAVMVVGLVFTGWAEEFGGVCPAEKALSPDLKARLETARKIAGNPALNTEQKILQLARVLGTKDRRKLGMALALLEQYMKVKEQFKQFAMHTGMGRYMATQDMLANLHLVQLGDLDWLSELKPRSASASQGMKYAVAELFGRRFIGDLLKIYEDYRSVAGVRGSSGYSVWDMPEQYEPQEEGTGAARFSQENPGDRGNDSGTGETGEGQTSESDSESDRYKGTQQVQQGVDEAHQQQDEVSERDRQQWEQQSSEWEREIQSEEVKIPESQQSEIQVIGQAANVYTMLTQGKTVNQMLNDYYKQLYRDLHSLYTDVASDLLDSLGLGNLPFADKLIELLWKEIACLFKKYFLPVFGLAFQMPTITVVTPCHTYTMTVDQALIKTVSFFDPSTGERIDTMWKNFRRCLGEYSPSGSLSTSTESADVEACQALYDAFLSGNVDERSLEEVEESGSGGSGSGGSGGGGGSILVKSTEQIIREEGERIKTFANPPLNFGSEHTDSVAYNQVMDVNNMMTGLGASGRLQVFLPGKEMVQKLAPALRLKYAAFAKNQLARHTYINAKIMRISKYRSELAAGMTHAGLECGVSVMDWSDTIDGIALPGKPLCAMYLPIGLGFTWPVWDKIMAGLPAGLRNGVAGPANTLDLAPPALTRVAKALTGGGSASRGNDNGMATTIEVDKYLRRVAERIEHRFRQMSSRVKDGERLLALADLDSIEKEYFAPDVRTVCHCPDCEAAVREAKMVLLREIKAAGATIIGAITTATTTLVEEVWRNMVLLGYMVAYQECLTRWVIRNEFRFWKKLYSAVSCTQIQLMLHQAEIDLDLLEVATMRLATMWAQETRRETEEWHKTLKIYRDQGLIPYVTTGVYPENIDKAYASHDDGYSEIDIE